MATVGEDVKSNYMKSIYGTEALVVAGLTFSWRFPYHPAANRMGSDTHHKLMRAMRPTSGSVYVRPRQYCRDKEIEGPGQSV
jgi:hypothetical protein